MNIELQNEPLHLTQLSGVPTLSQSPILNKSKFNIIMMMIMMRMMMIMMRGHMITWMPAPHVREQGDQADQAPESEAGSQDRVSTSEALGNIKSRIT